MTVQRLKNSFRDTVGEGILPYAYDIICWILIFSVPYSRQVPNAAMILMALLFFFRRGAADVRELFKSPAVFLYAWMAFMLGKGLLTGTTAENKYGVYLILLLLPPLLLKLRNKDTSLFAMVFMIIMASVRALIGVFSYYTAHHQLLPFEGSEINPILGMERPYLGFFTLVSAIASLKLAFSYRRYKYFFLAFSAYASVFVSLISARMSVGTIALLISIYLFVYLRMPVKAKIGLYLLAVVSVAAIFATNKTLSDRFFIGKTVDQSLAKAELYEPRVIIWDCASEIARLPEFNFWMGINSENRLDDLFSECYKGKISNPDRQAFFLRRNFNSHNQFIGLFLISGAIGLALLAGFFVNGLVSYRKNFLKTALVVSMLLFFGVENVLRRQMGVYFVAIILAILCDPDFQLRRRPKSDQSL